MTDTVDEPDHPGVIVELAWGGKIQHPDWFSWRDTPTGLDLYDQHGDVIATVAPGHWRYVHGGDTPPPTLTSWPPPQYPAPINHGDAF